MNDHVEIQAARTVENMYLTIYRFSRRNGPIALWTEFSKKLK